MPVSVYASSDSIIVYGVGYPPIRAQNEAQALLMARRAAIIDVYRNALRGSGEINNTDDETFYENISGFVKGMNIINEEYLSNGGVRIKASVLLTNKAKHIKEGSRGYFSEKQINLNKVTIEEWNRIISGMVRFEKIQ